MQQRSIIASDTLSVFRVEASDPFEMKENIKFPSARHPSLGFNLIYGYRFGKKWETEVIL